MGFKGNALNISYFLNGGKIRHFFFCKQQTIRLQIYINYIRLVGNIKKTVIKNIGKIN